MITLLLVLILVAGLAGCLFLLGFRLGGESWRQEVVNVRQDGVRASHAMHDLTRRAFSAMAEEAERHRRQR